MSHNLCILAAGLLVGQAQETPVVKYNAVQPKCNCGSAAPASGWTPVPNSYQTRTWTQTGTWTPEKGWTWHTAVTEGVEDRPILSRISERLGDIFGSAPETAKTTATKQPYGWQSTGWQSSGWHDENGIALHEDMPVGGAAPSSPAPLPVIVNHDAAPQPQQRMPVKVTLSEPPLLEVSAEPTLVQPALKQSAPTLAHAGQPANIKAASFQPPAATISKIDPKLADKVGHEDDYSWITGQLEAVNGAFILHYAPAEVVDRFGGRMVLNGTADMSRFKNGDLVTVHGNVLEGRNMSIYRVESIDAVEPAVRQK